jgi:hypothetical protein
MATKKEIKGANGFERLLRFIEQWVTLEVYNEIQLEIFSSRVIPLNGDKDHPNFWCVLWKGMVKL